MPLTLDQLHDLPSPFYRVAVKALVFDDQQRLLVTVNKDGKCEIPGGGWEHDESLKEGLQRELEEEVGVRASSIGAVEFVFQGVSKHGWHVVRVIVRAELESHDFTPDDGMVDAKFVSKAEFIQLDFDPADENIKDHADKIWP